MKMRLRTDSHNQWFVSAWVVIATRKVFVEFKVDNGCNGLVLNHKTLDDLGFSSNIKDLSKLPDATGTL
ncbi:MAG: hypothetical protein FWF77_03855 [Defluviitaleaceae bacterium]|nr:hypothetical protein [Defluviitaleaceae bacterium]